MFRRFAVGVRSAGHDSDPDVWGRLEPARERYSGPWWRVIHTA